ALQPKALMRVQQIIDDLRDQMALHIQNNNHDDSED
ncbi:terminase, partial [Pasteurella multocida]|nr:terminase [Pasteurella multocida]MDY0509543.1 terminase [Pasteurella multocida]MDY0661057.1 terminase [Pasteurella multocida]MDY0689175.1 terminase [Pasteurella multocida]